MTERSLEESHFSELLRNEVNTTFRKAGFYSALLGIGGGILLLVLILTGSVRDLLIPCIWAFVGGIYSVFAYLMAKNGMIYGFWQYVIFLPYVSIPSVIYIVAYFMLPSQTATYITGPPSYLYFFLIIVSGFLFNRKISTLSGFLAGVQYFFFYWLGREYLLQLSGPDPLVIQDLTAPPFYLFKSMTMLFSGIVVGILSTNIKRLLASMLDKERQRAYIDRVFGQYISLEVKDKIIREKKDEIAEVRYVAVLFSDIRCFSTFSENNAPSVVVRHLNEYFDRMVYSITSNGGIIDKFIGDAIMAVFGGVIEMENPAQQSLKAAIKMRQELALLNEQWKDGGMSAFQNGIGLHYGEVLQGTIGSQSRKEFTVIGDTVNIASRLESLSKDKGYPIILSQTIWERLSDADKAESLSLGETLVKGKSKPVNIFGYSA